MNGHSPDKIVVRFVGGVVALVFGVALLGFVVVPAIQGQSAGIDTWTAICRAIGIAPGSPAASTPQTAAAAAPVSDVAWTTDVLNRLAQPQPEMAQQLAETLCVACHGEDGISTTPQNPHLAGQSALAIYKQLHDYKSGARANELMTPVAQQLTEEQILAVANFYSSFSKGTLDRRLEWAGDPAVDHLVRTGDTARGIPGCQSCHGYGAGGPMETPTISGQHREYLAAQLANYASGTRKNDVFARMRDIAGRLSQQEIAALVQYYSTQRPQR